MLLQEKVGRISNYLLARNETTGIIEADNNEGIEDDNKCNVHVPDIIDVESKNIDVETKSIKMLMSTIIPFMLRW